MQNVEYAPLFSYIMTMTHYVVKRRLSASLAISMKGLQIQQHLKNVRTSLVLSIY